MKETWAIRLKAGGVYAHLVYCPTSSKILKALDLKHISFNRYRE